MDRIDHDHASVSVSRWPRRRGRSRLSLPVQFALVEAVSIFCKRLALDKSNVAMHRQ